MAKKISLFPKHPERICWGCDKYCAAVSLRCGNGSGRTPHPIELLGDDWLEHGKWGFELPKARHQGSTPAKGPDEPSES